jgi:putative transposase
MHVIVNSTSFLLFVFPRTFCDTVSMKQTLTAKLKLNTTQSQFAALRRTQLAYRDALNCVSRYSFEHGKISSNLGLHKGTYQEVRATFNLPSQMTCSVMREVAASYKGLWTKTKQNAAARKAGHTKKRYKGLDKPPTFVSPTLTYQYGKDYGFKVNQQVSLLTLDGRMVVSYQGYDEHIKLLKEGTSIGTAKLWYDTPHKRYFLLVSFEAEKPDPTPDQHTQIIGVDVGIRYLAVTSDNKGKPTFHSGKQVRNRANHYARLRKRLQKKGTRSATRRLKAISGRERRLKANANHTISRRIVTENPHALIGIEQLTHIRQRTKRRTHKRKKDGLGKAPYSAGNAALASPLRVNQPRGSVERVSVKQRKSNRVYSQWSFAELHGMLAYKAVLNGSMVVRVDADYTSKGCPKCGHIDDANRPNKGLLFCCINCHYTLHADLVGARNIVMRTLLVRQDWARTGQLSVAPGSSSEGPDVSIAEAKAARLKRYAELRWISDTSHWSLDQVVS